MSKKNKKIRIEDEAPELQNETPTMEEASPEIDNEEVAESESTQESDKTEANEWKDKYIRLYAEFENYKKRTLKEKTELILNGSEKTVTAVLPILDDFERALADKTEDSTAIKEGFELIYKKFFESLRKHWCKED